jgi:hypothetical protein
MGINYKGSQGQTKRAAVLREEEENSEGNMNSSEGTRVPAGIRLAILATGLPTHTGNHKPLSNITEVKTTVPAQKESMTPIYQRN